MKNQNRKLGAFRSTRAAAAPRKSKVSLIKQVAEGPDTINADGFPAFSDRSLEQSAARVVLCGIIKDQYYMPQELQAGEAVKILKNIAKANPLYLLKLAVLARQDNLKFMVKMAVAALSPYDQFTAKYENTIVQLLSTFHPGQLLEYVELQKSKVFGHGLGSRQQRWVRKVIESWDERTTVYYTLKYRKDLNILLRLAHPRTGPFRDYVLDKQVSKSELHPRQAALESIKDSKDVTKIAEIMIEHDIPWDVVKGFAPSTDRMWFAFMQQSGTSAVLLNTRNYAKHGVFELKNGVEEFKTLLSKERVAKARLLPLDVAKTVSALQGENVPAAITKHLTQVFAHSFLTPLPGLQGKRVAVSIDVSGSMHGENLLRAGTVAASFIDQAKETWVTAFDDNLFEEGSTYLPQLSGISKEKMVKNLMELQAHGSTDTSLAVARALREGREFDVFIIITDEQQNTGSHLVEVFQNYRKRVNEDALLIIVNITDYPWHNAMGDNIYLFNTVTPALFKSVEYLGQDLTEVVNAVKIE